MGKNILVFSDGTGQAGGLQLPFLWLFWRSHADLDRNWSPGLESR